MSVGGVTILLTVLTVVVTQVSVRVRVNMVVAELHRLLWYAVRRGEVRRLEVSGRRMAERVSVAERTPASAGPQLIQGAMGTHQLPSVLGRRIYNKLLICSVREIKLRWFDILQQIKAIKVNM